MTGNPELKQVELQGVSRNDVLGDNACQVNAMETHPTDRFGRVLSKAISVFGDETTARHWMVQPLVRFENKTAVEMLSTEEGAQLIEQVLVQIEEGIFP